MGEATNNITMNTLHDKSTFRKSKSIAHIFKLKWHFNRNSRDIIFVTFCDHFCEIMGQKKKQQ